MSFPRRPKPKKILLTPQEDDDPTTSPAAASPSESSAPPAFKPKKRAGVKLSFGASPTSIGGGDSGEDEEPITFIKKPLRKRPGLVSASTGSSTDLRKAVLLDSTTIPAFRVDSEDTIVGSPDIDLTDAPSIPSTLSTPAGSTTSTTAGLKSLRLTPGTTPAPTSYFEAARPSYSKEYLEELRAATPKATREVFQGEDGEKITEALEGDVVMEGTTPSASGMGGGIMEEAQVRRLKAQRAERARGGGGADDGFISLNSGRQESDSEEEDYSSRRKKGKESRLVRPEILDDQDEELQSYVDDGALSLAPSARRMEALRKRRDIASQIEEAEEDNRAAESAESSSSEGELGFERDQLRKATGKATSSSRRFNTVEERLRYVPPKIRPLPSMKEAVAALREKIRVVEEERERTAKRLESVRREGEEIARREEEVRRLMEEAGKRYEGLVKGMSGVGLEGGTGKVERGLESMTPVR